jgi:hypothetical protein
MKARWCALVAMVLVSAAAPRAQQKYVDQSAE